MSYTWIAKYRDGSLLPQYGENGERSYEHLDKSQLDSFILVKDAIPVITLHLDPEQRLIYRRRVEVSPGEGITSVCHLVGWQQTINGKNIQSIAYCFEDGRIELAGAFRPNHPWFYAPILTEHEIAERKDVDRK